MVRFINTDGLGVSTKIVTEDGEDITKLLSVSYGAVITIGQQVTAQCELLTARVDIAVDKVEWHTKHPITGQPEPLAEIVFKDGTRLGFADDGAPVAKT